MPITHKEQNVTQDSFFNSSMKKKFQSFMLN